MVLPLSWLPDARPLSWELLVERFETEERYGGLIYLTDASVTSVRPPFAKILKVGPAVDASWGFEPGGIVALNPVAGVRLLFGDSSRNQRYVYSITPHMVICGVRPDQVGEGRVEDAGESPFRREGRDPREGIMAEERKDQAWVGTKGPR